MAFSAPEVQSGGVSSFGYSGTIAHAVLAFGQGEVREALAFGRAADSSEVLGFGPRGAEAAGDPFLAGCSERDAGRLLFVMRAPLTYRRRAFQWHNEASFAKTPTSTVFSRPTHALAIPSMHSISVQEMLDADLPLMRAGVTSIATVRLSSQLRALTGIELSPTLIFEYPTTRSIASHLADSFAPEEFTRVEALTSLVQEELTQSQSNAMMTAALPKSYLNIVAGVPMDAQLPCSSLQHQLLLHQQLQPKSTAYNEPVLIAIESPLTEPIAHSALHALVRRHAVLRTHYALDARAATFYQVVLPADGHSVPLTCYFAALAWRDDLDRELHTRFDLFAAPPIRAVMLQAETSYLVINVHHVATDMDAMAIIRGEVATHCAALALLHPPPSLALLERDYADFALWEHARGHDDATWWVSQLAGAPDLIDLPLDHPRPDLQATAGSHHELIIDQQLTGHIMTVCSTAGATLNSTLLAFWGSLLLRISGQKDVIIGVPHSMRYRALHSLTAFNCHCPNKC